MIVYAIRYNWESQDRFSQYIVGDSGVDRIEQHPAIGEGDRWFYDVHLKDGSMHRIFNPNQVFFRPE